MRRIRLGLAVVVTFFACLASAQALSQGAYTAKLVQAVSFRAVHSALTPIKLAFGSIHRAKAGASEPSWLLQHADHVRQASVLVLAKSCAGFVAGSSDQVVTAAHCIPETLGKITLQTRDGRQYVARLDRIDRDTDLALLRLGRRLPVTPLALSTAVPARGDLVLFVGRSDRGGDAQVASVSKIGRCPSLPAVPNAVFTSIEARPGDSGAPLLDAQVRVIGLVHGGARCHIAAPVASLARQLEEEEGPPCVEAQAGAIRSTEVRCSELQLLQDTATAL